MNSQQKPVAGNPADAGADTSSKTPAHRKAATKAPVVTRLKPR